MNKFSVDLILAFHIGVPTELNEKLLFLKHQLRGGNYLKNSFILKLQVSTEFAGIAALNNRKVFILNLVGFGVVCKFCS